MRSWLQSHQTHVGLSVLKVPDLLARAVQSAMDPGMEGLGPLAKLTWPLHGYVLPPPPPPPENNNDNNKNGSHLLPTHQTLSKQTQRQTRWYWTYVCGWEGGVKKKNSSSYTVNPPSPPPTSPKCKCFKSNSNSRIKSITFLPCFILWEPTKLLLGTDVLIARVLTAEITACITYLLSTCRHFADTQPAECKGRNLLLVLEKKIQLTHPTLWQ